ncbi:MAG: hypothetical protein LBH26_00455 [Treponema sp.]|nr:hypothetical protein [Treponema sp.]
MNANLLRAVRNLVSSQGGGILSDPRRADENLPVFAGRDSAAEREIFIRCLESGLAAGLRGEPNPEKRLERKKQSARKLIGTYGYPVTTVKEMFDLVEEAVCGSVSGRGGAGSPAPLPPVPRPPVPRGAGKIRVKKILGALGIALALAGAGILVYRNVPETVAAFEPLVEFHGEAFPVKILALAAKNTALDGSARMKNDGPYIGDVFGDFGVALSLKRAGPVRVEIEGDRFIKLSVQEALVPANNKVEIFPRISYVYSELERLTQPGTENVYFRLYKNGKLLKEEMKVIRFHSVNEVPFKEISRWDGESVLSYGWLFAAYVNEDDPLIDEILKEALEIARREKAGVGDIYAFSGYQDIDGDGGAGAEVRIQVYAIWRVLQDRGIRYSDITTTSTGNQSVATQYVRTLRESFSNSQANCVDGTVLFASVLRRLGISPYLVLIPGHMFLGYNLDSGGEMIAFLETTMLDSVNPGDYPNHRRARVSLDSFIAASASALKTWETVENKMLDDSDIEHQIISVAECRMNGIMPVKRE